MSQLYLKTKHRLLPVLMATACSAAHAAGISGLQAACKTDSGPGTSLPYVQVRAVAAEAEDLPYYEAHSNATGGSVRIYHDPALADAAASKAACFMGMLDLLSTALPYVDGKVTWSPMVITSNKNYIPPKRDGELRWVNVFGSTAWDTELPRWFEEGHADWTGLQVTEQIRPDLAQSERTQRADDFRKLGAAHLGAWGGIRVKPEAIERQLSAEDRERRRKDPSYNPPGPFSFQSGDFEEDNGGETGRYGAALALFTGLEQRHGRAAVQA
jgi:hypothetical protein